MHQKFDPLILEKAFIPRQRLILARITNENVIIKSIYLIKSLKNYRKFTYFLCFQIIVFMYNCSKDKTEKLIKQISNLGIWLSSRSNLSANITMQKLGIFHYQPLFTDEQEEVSPSNYQITDVDSFAKFPQTTNSDYKDFQRTSSRIQTGKNVEYSWSRLIGQVMRDAKPSGHYPPNTNDSVIKAALDFQELLHKNKKIRG